MLFVYKSQYSGRILRLVFAFQLPQGLAELEAEQEYEVFVDDALREESKKPLERMLELAK